MHDADERAGSSGRRITTAALLLAASALLSRILGFVRDAVLAFQVGVGPEADAYAAAFQIPDLLNYLLAGGALSIAFVPLYTRARSRDGDAAADRLLATALGSLGACAILATLGLWWFAPELIELLFPRFAPGQQQLTARLTRIVLPAQVFFVCGGIVRAALMAHGRFGAQAAAPLLYNLGIIAGGLWLAPDLGVEGFAWGALVGAFVGPFVLTLWDARGRVALGIRIAPWDRAFLGYLAVAAPLMVGVTLLTVDEWYDRVFGQLGVEGTIATLAYARKLMLVPVAVVGQTIGTAALPTLSRLWAEGRRPELDHLVLRALQAGVGLGLLGGAATFAFAEPLVALVYQRGAFGASDASAVAATLAILAIAVPAWIAQQVAVRPFYARGDTWRPMLLGTVLALVAAPLYAFLAPRYGAPGLAAAGAAAIGMNALATLALARRLHGAPDLGALAASALRLAAVALVAGALACLVQPGRDGAFGALLDLAAGGAAFAAAAALGVALLADAPTREAWLGFFRRPARR